VRLQRLERTGRLRLEHLRPAARPVHRDQRSLVTRLVTEQVLSRFSTIPDASTPRRGLATVTARKQPTPEDWSGYPPIAPSDRRNDSDPDDRRRVGVTFSQRGSLAPPRKLSVHSDESPPQANLAGLTELLRSRAQCKTDAVRTILNLVWLVLSGFWLALRTRSPE